MKPQTHNAAGPLRRRMVLQRRVESRERGGGTVWTFETVKPIYVRDRALSGRELFLAQQVAAEVTHELVVRRFAEIVPKARLVETSGDSPPRITYFDITAVLPHEDRVMVRVLCVVRDADGWRG